MSDMRTHRVRPGETLASIAQDYYGDQKMYAYIFNHNKFYIQNPNVLAVGQVIVIPHMPLKHMLTEFVEEAMGIND